MCFACGYVPGQSWAGYALAALVVALIALSILRH